nr:PREDICTED: periphilin-1-like [Equus przewalskii]
MGRARETRRARALGSVGAQPRLSLAPRSGLGITGAGMGQTRAPEAGPEAGAFADVFARAGSACLTERRRGDDCVCGISRRPRVVAYRRNEMWSEGRYDYDRLPRERVPPRSHPSDGYHRVVNIVPKKPPLLDRPGEGSYNRYYSHVDYRDYDEGRSFSHDRRSGPPHRGDESGYRWTRDDHSAGRQPEYR